MQGLHVGITRSRHYLDCVRARLGINGRILESQVVALRRALCIMGALMDAMRIKALRTGGGGADKRQRQQPHAQHGKSVHGRDVGTHKGVTK